jgi:hypothetical protein
VSRSSAVLLVLAVLVVAVLTACGSDDSGGSSTADKAAAPSAQTTTPAAATTPPAATTPATATPEKKATVVAKCHAAFDPYLTALHEIQGTVDGTPKFKTYIAAVDQLVDKYSNNINNIKMPSTSCQKAVLLPLTTAYIKYYNMDQKWNACHQRQRCAAAMADMKKEWEQASTLVKSADKGFSSVTAH